MKELIEQTKKDLIIAYNYFNNIVDDEDKYLVDIAIREIDYLEERLNIFYKIAKKGE